MLTGIKLKNFKCFKNEVIIPVDGINLFTGLNGRGKSTALQPILCLRQSLENVKAADRLFLNGSCVSLGNYGDIKNVSTPRSEDIEFVFDFESETNYFSIAFHFEEDEEDDLVIRVKRIDIEGECGLPFSLSVLNENGMAVVQERNIKEPFYNLFIDPHRTNDLQIKFVCEHLFRLNRIHYVSADRIGPRDYYPRESYGDFLNVGSRGQHTVDVLARKSNKTVTEKLCIREIGSDIVVDQVSAWLNYIFTGGKVDIEHFEANIIGMRMNSDGSANRFKPINVGFGYSYVLPILVSGLIAEPGDILIVENPEAHLVPFAQSRIAEFLAMVSRAGVQVFIESHSDHILNGIRISVKKEPSTHKSTNILFFQDGTDNPLLKIPVDEEGLIKNWPQNFFDQSEKDFQKLHGI